MLLGVQSVNVQLERSLVTVSTVLSAVRVQELIEDTGRKAVLFGVKATEGSFHSLLILVILVITYTVIIIIMSRAPTGA